MLPVLFAKTAYGPYLQKRQNNEDEQQVTGVIALSLDNIGSAQRSLQIETGKDLVDLGIEIVLPIYHIVFNFPFELLAFCGNHCLGLLSWLCVLFSETYTYHKRQPFTTIIANRCSNFVALNPYWGCET